MSQREYAEDTVFWALKPHTSFSARRRTTQLFLADPTPPGSPASYSWIENTDTVWRELRAGADAGGHDLRPAKSFLAAAWAVAVADVSMSLDNVLAVAGAARDHPGILIVGLILSVILMGVAANLLARVIERFKWIAYLGLAVILWVAGKMIYEGTTHPTTGVLTLFA